MKKLILGAVALVSLTCQAVAQSPTSPSTVPVVTPPPVPTNMPAPPPVPTPPNNQKEKGEKHRGDHDNNKGGERKEERAWENHGRKNKKEKEEHKGKKEERKTEQGERKEERGERKTERKEERKEQKMERKEQKVERKEARAEKLDRMKAYLNLSADQESRMSTAIQSFRSGAKAVKENKNWSPEQKKAQLEKLVAERNAQLKSILTPEQMAKLAEAQKQGQAQGNKHGFINDEMGDDDLF
jgi:hypothetical protein